MIPELRYLSYEERLNEFGLTLEKRRLRGYNFFEILNMYENIDITILSYSRKIVELEDTR